MGGRGCFSPSAPPRKRRRGGLSRGASSQRYGCLRVSWGGCSVGGHTGAGRDARAGWSLPLRLQAAICGCGYAVVPRHVTQWSRGFRPRRGQCVLPLCEFWAGAPTPRGSRRGACGVGTPAVRRARLPAQFQGGTDPHPPPRRPHAPTGAHRPLALGKQPGTRQRRWRNVQSLHGEADRASTAPPTTPVNRNAPATIAIPALLSMTIASASNPLPRMPIALSNP